MIAKKIIYCFMLSLLILFLCGTNALGSDEITATRGISDTSVDAGDTFTVTLSVDVNSKIEALFIEETIPSGWRISEVDSDNANFNTNSWIYTDVLNQGESKTIVYEIAVPDSASGGVYSISGIASFFNPDGPALQPGDTEIEITITGDTQVTVGHSSSTSSSSSSASSSSGGGGGGGTSGEKYENVLKKEVETVYINKGSSIKYEFSADENAIDYIQFTGLKNSGQISTTIEVLNGRSAFADSDASGLIYQNMNIWVGKVGFATSDNIENPAIGFSVKKEWMNKNGITSDDIVLYRYSDDVWNELETSVLSDDDTYVYFESKTPGFSPFAVAASVNKETVSVSSSAAEDVEKLESTTEINEEEKTTPVEAAQSTPGFGVLGTILGVVIAGIFATMKGRK
ncbi:PGF-pre-PGF domain-containing protein [Methanolobus psychrotolerans]|uniref:PGF-pre-PGF domain-containing protein n=1 Tax=Methanolobus psychrotolerans TaxID=1874706 RepID=UPI000B916CCA|nr:PGF-pre-PGF domain-containing protein [Methanolobus psychrotolerans]